MTKREHIHSRKKAHSGSSHNPTGRVMPSVRDAKGDDGKLDMNIMRQHLEAVASSFEQREYVPSESDGCDGALTTEGVRAAKVLGVDAKEGWDYVLLAGKRQT